VDRDASVLQSYGLDLIYAINTHCHADHVTGTGMLRKKHFPSARTVISEAAGAKADVLVKHGDAIAFGCYSLEVRATPGHTSGCVSYVLSPVEETGGAKFVFTGDALLIGGCGRTDFQQGDSDTLYASVHAQIFSLSDDTLVYPAHDYKGRTHSTVGHEKQHNPRLAHADGLEGFRKVMANLNLPYPKKIDVALPMNLLCGVQE